MDCGQVNILPEVNHRPLAHYIEEDVMPKCYCKEFDAAGCELGEETMLVAVDGLNEALKRFSDMDLHEECVEVRVRVETNNV